MASFNPPIMKSTKIPTAILIYFAAPPGANYLYSHRGQTYLAVPFASANPLSPALFLSIYRIISISI